MKFLRKQLYKYGLYISIIVSFLAVEIFKIYYPIMSLLAPYIYLFVTLFILLFLSHKLRILTRNITKSISGLDDNFTYLAPTSKIYTFEDVDNLVEALNLSIENTYALKSKYTSAIGEIEIHEQLRDVLFLISDRIINSTEPNLSDVYEYIIEKAIEIVPDAEIGSLTLVNSDDQLEFIASKGYNWEVLKNIKLNKKDTFLWKFSSENVSSPIIVRDVQSYNKDNLSRNEFEELSKSDADRIEVSLTAPIYIDDHLIGTMSLDSVNRDAFHDEDKKIIGFFTSLIGIALKNRNLMEESIYLSRHDKLTGIYNRRYFEELFLQFQERSFNYSHKFSLVLMDLNYLKSINDNFGHVTGDIALKGFVDRIKSHLTSNEVFTRFGGDEFIILLPNTTYKQSSDRMEEIFNDFKNYFINSNSLKIPVQF
ncbi:MAG: sensor domain-containing diguanylate cyclase, partial [Acidaminobacteraceae bacterium]